MLGKIGALAINLTQLGYSREKFEGTGMGCTLWKKQAIGEAMVAFGSDAGSAGGKEPGFLYLFDASADDGAGCKIQSLP